MNTEETLGARGHRLTHSQWHETKRGPQRHKTRNDKREKDRCLCERKRFTQQHNELLPQRKNRVAIGKYQREILEKAGTGKELHDISERGDKRNCRSERSRKKRDGADARTAHCGDPDAAHDPIMQKRRKLGFRCF